MDGLNGGYSVEMWRAEGETNEKASELQRKVWEELRWEPELETCDLDVYVTGDEVTLAGTVQRYPQKTAAECATSRVPGVTAVSNRIRVDPRAEDCRTDEEIAEEVRRVLGWDTLVPGGIDVAVRNGIVMLRGTVDREHQRTAAEQAVEPLVGVIGIANRISVRPMYVTGGVQARVVAAIRRVREQHVVVATHGGTVELRGHVASLAHRGQIEHLVREIPGVTSVEDGLKIQP